MAGLLTYDSNNSGGKWWLSDGDWLALEASGWEVAWEKDAQGPLSTLVKDGRFLGALARSASKRFDSVDDGISEWQSITSESAADLGCYSCCGPPHDFRWQSDDGEVRHISPEAVGILNT